MGFDYFYGRGAEPFAFIQVPRVLIEDERFADITTDAKLLYSFMLNRSFLSARSGWLDDAGRVYIYYTLDQVMADMRCANQKATKLVRELETKGLIERRKRGQGKATRIYVRDFATGLHGDGNGARQIETHENHDSQTHENRESRDVKITSPDSWKSCTNKTHINHTDVRETDPINLSAESANPEEKTIRMDDPMRIRKQYEDCLREKLSIDVLIQNNPCDVGRINEIFNLMLDVLCSTAKTIRISGDDKPIDVVRAQFMKIDSGHMEYILDCFKHQITDIRNVKQYLLATIYNAPLTIDHYYTSKVSYDMTH